MASKFAKSKAERKALESKYTKLALFFEGEFQKISQNKISSVSPAAYYYATGANASSEDIKKNAECNKVLHSDKNNSKRAIVERKIKNFFLEKENGEATKLPTFKLKEIFNNISYEEYSKLIKAHNFLSITDKYYVNELEDSNSNVFIKINKNKFNELQNLFAQFGELSKYEHYQPNNAEKRIIKKKGLIY